MTNFIKIKYLTLLPIISLSLAACNPGASIATTAATTQPAAESKTAATVAPTKETKSQAAEATTAPTEAAPTAETKVDDSGSFADVAENLDNLSSYRIRMVYGFVGKDDEQKDVNASYEIIQETIKASGDYHLKMTNSDDTQAVTKTTTIEMYRIGKDTYMLNAESEADTKCISFSSEDSKSNVGFSPKDMLGGGLKSAKLVEKGVTVNGVVADHYTYSDQAIMMGGAMKGSGEYWIAQDGRYVVKYSGKATGKGAGLLVKAAEGAISWDYDLDAVNSLQKIELPADCANAKPSADIPVPDNATDKGQFGTMLTFKTKDEVGKVADYYKQQLPDKGWELTKDDTMGELVSLEFTKDKRTLSIMITKGDDGTTVLINEKKE